MGSGENRDPLSVGVTLRAASFAYVSGRYGDAHRLAEQLVGLLEQAGSKPNPSLVLGLTLLARVDTALGRLDQAETELARAEASATQIPYSRAPFDLELLQARADLAAARGDRAGQEQYARRILDAAQELFGPYSSAAAEAEERLAEALSAQGKFAEMLQFRRDALAKVERMLGPQHPAVARAARGLATALVQRARPGEAQTLYERAATSDKLAFGEDSNQAALDHLGLGSVFRTQLRFDEALVETERARSIWKRLDNLVGLRASLSLLAFIAEDQASLPEAIVHSERMLSYAEQSFGPDSVALTPSLLQLARNYLGAGRIEDGEHLVSRMEHLIGSEYATELAQPTIDLLIAKSALHRARRDFATAEDLSARAVALTAKYAGPMSHESALREYELALTNLEANHLDDAISNFGMALRVFEREGGRDSAFVGSALLGIAQGYARKGKKGISAAFLKRAQEVLSRLPAARHTRRPAIRAL
jgi:hypothetical protein